MIYNEQTQDCPFRCIKVLELSLGSLLPFYYYLPLLFSLPTFLAKMLHLSNDRKTIVIAIVVIITKLPFIELPVFQRLLLLGF